MKTPRYTIIETDSGPFISESRVTVYDVMKDYDDGDGIYRIARTYKLSPLQVKTAIAYIEEHREVLESELAEILVKKAEREHYYRALEEKRKKERPQEPMTPRRKALYALIEKSRRELEEMTNANHSYRCSDNLFDSRPDGSFTVGSEAPNSKSFSEGRSIARC